MKKLILSLLMISNLAEANMNRANCTPRENANHNHFAIFEGEQTTFNGTAPAVLSIYDGETMKLFTDAEVYNFYSHGIIFTQIDTHPQNAGIGYELTIEIANNGNPVRHFLLKKKKREVLYMNCL